MRSTNLRTATLVALLLITSQFSLAQYAISTVAGGGPNNLTALKASIGYPGSIAFDSAGNAYIADSYSNRILKVDTANNVTVAAGNGTSGFSGDGGPATSAALNNPEGIAVDGSGNIFVADTDNCLIREISGGNISTVAGSPTLGCGYAGDGALATSAQLYDPNGVFIDANGNIFIADTDNCLIRKVSAGNISTVAGSPTLGCGYAGDGALATSAQIDEPFGVFVDGAGDIFIADTANSVIREVTIANLNIQTVAGVYYDYLSTGVCQYSGDGALATAAYLCQPSGVYVDGSQNIYIADTYNAVIREVTAASGNIATVAGDNALGAGYSGDAGPATSAQLNYPNAIFVDASGDIFIADTLNFVIREVTAGNINTKIGNNTLAYSGDGGPAVDAELSAPGSLSADALGDIFIADSNNSVIREVVATTGDIQTVAGGTSACALPLLPVPPFCGDGGSATSAMLNSPAGVFIDGAGNIFIADTGDNLIRVVNTSAQPITIANVTVPAGAIETVAGKGTGGYSGDAGPATSAELNYPSGVFVDSAENIFIVDTGNSVIREVSSAGIITTVVGNGTQCSPSTSACGDGGAATSAQLSAPTSVFVDTNEDIFVADTFDNRIRVAVNPSATAPVTIAGVTIAAGNIASVAGTGARGFAGDGAASTGALLDTPHGVFVDASGDIFIADTDNAAIREVVAATGFIQTVAGTPLTSGFSGDGGPATIAELNSPSGVFGNSAGSLFVADTRNMRIRELVQSIFVTVTPNPVNVGVSAQQTFTATVTGTSNTAVTWQVNGIADGNTTVGTISAAGLYQAPATIPTPSTVTITAISAADGTTSGSAQATIVTGNSNITVTVSTNPPITQVNTGTLQTFIATVTGTTNTAVTWQVNGTTGGNATVGTIDTAGNYTAPAAVPAPATVTIEAISQALSTAIGSESVTIITAPSAADPTPQTAAPGGTAQYSLLLNQNTGAPGKALTLSCAQSSLPLGGTCTFSPTSIMPGSQAVPFSLTITVPTGSAALEYPKSNKSMRLAVYASFLPLVGIFFVRVGRGKGQRHGLLLTGMFAILMLMNACGGANSSSTPRNPELGTYNVKVQGTTSAQPNPVTITIAGLTVQ